MIYLLSEKRLKADFLNDNIASELILPSIQTAQDIFLRQTLGDSLLDRICNMIREDELQEPYKTLLDEYIIIYLEYLAMAELCVPSTFKLGNIGVAQAYDNNVNTQTIQNVKYLESYYKQKASFYENRLTTFIQQHCNLFPEYRDTTTVTTAQESTLQCGIYLGSTTSRKKIINNNSNNNNTEVGNYVRYDKAQNLSELEKAQARENIGVSSGGSADLSNYYTKEQTDTAIQNAIDNIDIPDTDLSNYYTKEQTYNKSEVNDLIDNVNSGEVDLSNYYKKNETYSKYEVDSLVENIDVPTKTSELELDNVYSKEEVDTLVANSNATIVDIMSLNYNEQLELINYIIDNNKFPDINTLYIYQGYVLNNLKTYSDWWDEALNQRYIIFDLYAHPKSYDIRFITYEWNNGKIYNDIIEKDSWNWLVTNGEVDDKLNRLSSGSVLDLNRYDNDELLSVYYIIKNGQTYTDKPITYRGKFINNVTIEGENVRFWHYAITTDSNTINSDKTFYVDVELYDTEMYLVSAIYNEIGDCTDLSNYYTKEQTFTRQEIVDMINEINYSDINNTPTLSNVATSGSYNDLTDKPQIYTTEQVYSKSEIDLLFAEINTTLGDINNTLNEI